MTEKRHWLTAKPLLAALTAILLFGYLCRLLYLGDQSLWGDEAFTYMVTKAEDWLATLSRDVHPPLYFAFITVWTRIAGISEFSFRYPSLLAGVVNIALISVLARELIHHRPRPTPASVPLLAALLLALADLEILVGQEARSYTLHLVWLLVSVISYLRWLRIGKPRWAVAFILSTAAVVYTHYIGAFTPIAIGVHALLFLRGKQRVQAIGLLIGAALLFTPWLLSVVLPQQVGKFAGDVVLAAPSNWQTLWSFRITWFTQQWPLLLGLALLGLVSLQYTAYRWWVRWVPLRASGILVLWIVVPLVLAFWSNLYLPTLHDYRISQITPAVMLLIAFGLGNLRGFTQTFIIIIIVVYGVTTVDSYRPKPPWRELGTMIAQYAQPDDLVLMDFTGGDYTVEYYLDQMLPMDVAVASMWQWRTFEPETYESGILGTLDSHDHIWLARWSSTDEAFVKLAVTGHTQTDRRSIDHFGNALEVYRFDRLAAVPIEEFENGMVLQAANVAADAQQVDLWWRTTQTLEHDYTVSVKWWDAADQLLAQSDVPLTPETSGWTSQTLDYDPHQAQVASPPTRITAQLYRWENDGIVPVLSTSSNDMINIVVFTPT